MNITFRYLRQFVAAARCGSITRAAEELHLSQSAVATSLNRLEEEVGEQLLVRLPAKGLALTTRGRQVLRHSTELLEDYRKFEGNVLGARDNPVGEISVGCFSVSAPYFIPPIVAAMKKKYPDVSIKLYEGDLQEIQDGLQGGLTDIMITYDLELLPEFERIHLSTVPTHAVLSVDDPLCSMSRLKLSDLALKPLILLDVPVSSRYFLSIFEAENLMPIISYRSKSVEMIRNLVGWGLGYTIFHIKSQEITSHGQKLAFRPIEGVANQPNLVIAHHKHLAQLPAIDVFIAECRAYFLSELHAVQRVT